MKNLRAILLAAGKGTRMKSETPKVLHPLCGRPVLTYSLECVLGVNAVKVSVVVGHGRRAVEEFLKTQYPKVDIVEQRRLKGTADAVRLFVSSLKRFSGDVLILCGDAPLVRKESLKALYRLHKKKGADVTFLTAVVADPKGYGRVLRDQNGRPAAIREDKDASEIEKHIVEINTGVYCFKSKTLADVVPRIPLNPVKKEYYLTDAIELLAEEGAVVEALETSDPYEGVGINTRKDLALCESVLRQRILDHLMLSGVTITSPETTFIQSGVQIGADTVIYPFTVIEGPVKIGRGCRIGPFARIRPGCRIGDDVEIGNFTEVSRSSIGKQTLMKHFSYLGDAVVGAGVNIGAGVVTANFDGREKHQTRIGDQAFVGSDSILVAPARVGRRAVTGAGSVLPAGRAVPEGKVAVGVPARVIKARSDSQGKPQSTSTGR